MFLVNICETVILSHLKEEHRLKAFKESVDILLVLSGRRYRRVTFL
jgi:hypothetical protein